MKQELFKTIRYAFLLGCLAMLAVSCEEDKEIGEFNPPRMFTPTAIQITSGETQAQLAWPPSLFSVGKDVSYTVELSKDAQFTTVDQTFTADTNRIILTDDKLVIRQQYFARIKTNATGTSAESNWLVSPVFSISGEQIFSPVVAAELKDKSVILRWRATSGLTKITVKPQTGVAVDVTLSAGDVTAAFKNVTGLTASTAYTAEIFAGAKSKGTITFTTKEPSIFTVEITPADDLIAAINIAANNAVIGLNPGTYNYTTLNLIITGKHITLQSTSGNAANTKVNFKEITLKGTGAGVKVSGIEFDGTAGNADYFINLVGLNADADAATFTSVFIDNSIVHNTNNCLIRANRAGNNAHKIDFIKMNNSVAYANGTGTYHYFMLDKLEFKTIDIKNTTFYDIARAFISWATNLTMPARPVITVDQVTINNFGFGDRNNILLDANTNNVDFTMQNSIIANTPKPGQAILGSALRSGTGGTVKFTNNNYFNFNGGSPLAVLTFPANVQMSANKTIDLGWTATTTNFTLPAGSQLRTSGTAGGVIGDLRWQ